MATNFDSPLHSLEHVAWKSDYVLCGYSTREFRELHKTVSASLEQLDTEIARVQAGLDKLRHKRALCKSRIDKIDSAVAPHKKLPPEILSQVFNYAFEGWIHIGLKRNALKTRHMPVSSQVCCRWRQVTLNTRAFWNFIEMTCEIDDLEYSSSIVGSAQNILSLGCNSISLHLVDHRTSLVHHHKNPSIPALIHTFSAVAKHIGLSTSSSPLLHEVLGLSPPFFPVLESVSISNMGSPGRDIRKCSIFNNSPHLASVRITDTNELALVSQPSFELPWVQLQHMHFESPITLSDAHLILSRCSNLTHCTLHQIRSDLDEALVPPSFISGSISLPYLHSLKLHSSLKPGALPKTTPFLGRLLLPSLKVLHFSSPTDDVWFTGVVPLLKRSSCTLEKLIVDTKLYPRGVPDDVFDLLFEAISPGLEVLAIPYIKLPLVMLPRIAGQALFPRLQFLAFAIDNSSAALEGLMGLVQRRCLDNVTEGGASKIQSVHVLSDRYDPPGPGDGVAGWPHDFNRFNALTEEVARQGRIVVLKSS